MQTNKKTLNDKKKIFNSHWSKWMHTNENRFLNDKRRWEWVRTK